MGNRMPKWSEDSNIIIPKESEKKIGEFVIDEGNREDYHNNVDILFVLDTTSSMDSYIKPAMITIQKIVQTFSEMEYNIMFSICLYRDHPPQDQTYVTSFSDLMTGKKMVEFLSTVSVQGGGDEPEAVMDGLRDGLSKTSWRVGDDNVTLSKRFIFHICDAPPHGKEYGGQSTDPSWKKNGCPCGTKKEDINNLLKKHNVDYHLIKAVSKIDKMENIFKKCFGKNYAETIQLDPQDNYVPLNDGIFSPPIKNEGECYIADSIPNKCEEIDVPYSLDYENVTNLESKVMHCTNLKSNDEKSKKTMWNGVVNALHKKL